jgi:hypothetical protein
MARKSYSVEEDLKPFMFPLTNAWDMSKIARLPNLEEVTDPKEALIAINRRRQQHQYYNSAFNLPSGNPKWPERYLTYAKLYTEWTSGGGWDGVGYVVTSHNTDEGRVFKFTMCKHEKTEEGHSPNHGRGWHPGHCKHCGMDMTVDSGD